MESLIGNSIDTGTGAFLQGKRIVSIQGGRNLDFALYYNSLLSQTRGPVGFGWSHNCEATIEGNPESAGKRDRIHPAAEILVNNEQECH